jgi:putative intracellular protease/amidase
MNEYTSFIDFLHAHGFTVGIVVVTSTVPATTVDNPSNIEPKTVVFEVTRDNKTVIFKQKEFDRLQKLPIDKIEAKFQKHK